MRNKPTALQITLATFGVAIVAGIVWAGVGAELHVNSQTGKSFPQQISAGYLATADGGVVNVMASPGPTAAQESLVTDDPTHATWKPVVTFAGSGTADPSVAPGVVAKIMSIYYQTSHATDAGVMFGIWFKNGACDTCWTPLESGSGSSQSIALISPDGSLNIGASGGNTTAETNLGSLTTNRLTKALTGYTNRLTDSLVSDDGATVGVHASMGAASFLNTNADNQASTTLLNPGITFFGAGGNLYGCNLGYTSYYNVQCFAPSGRTIEWGSMDNPAVNQSSFHGGMVFDTTTHGLSVGGPVTASNITATPTPSMIVKADTNGTVCPWVTDCGYQTELPACDTGQELVNGTRTDTAVGTDTSTAWSCRTSPWQPAGSYQDTLPGCAPGQSLVNGTVTQTGTDTNTTTTRTCQNPPSYQPVLPPGHNNDVLAFSVTGTGTGTGITAKTPSVVGGNGITISGGSNPVTGITIAENVSTKHDIDTSTGSATTTAIATAVYGDNAQVRIPKASTTGAGIAQQGKNAVIASSDSTGTRSSTDTSNQFMPIDATANGDHQVMSRSSVAPGYLCAVTYSDSLSISDCNADSAVLDIECPTASTGAKGCTQIDAVGGAEHTLPGGTNGQVLNYSTTGTGTTTNLQPTTLTIPSVSGSTNRLTKFCGSNSVCNAVGSDDGTEMSAGGNYKFGASPPNFQGPSGYGGLNFGTRSMLFFSNTDTNNVVEMVSNAYLDASSVWRYQNTGPASIIGALNGGVSVFTAASGTAGAAITWTTPANVTPTGVHAAGMLRGIQSVILSVTTSSALDGSWTTILTNSTSGYAGKVVVQGSASLSQNVGGSLCKAQIALDSVAIGSEATGTPTTGYVNLTPIGYAAFSAGSHAVSLQIGSLNGSSCSALVSEPIHRASLIITEYTTTAE